MDKAAEIQSAVSSFRTNTNWLKLKSRWQSDFSLYRLAPYNAGAGYYSYTSNSPRIIADKAISILESSKLIVRIPEELLTEEEKEIANDCERFIYGALNQNDEESFYIPEKRTLRQLKAWYAVVRGGFAERIYVHKDEDGETKPEIAVWDIYNTAYGTDDKGIAWAAHTYKISAHQAQETWKISSGTQDVECIDFWDREKNVFIVQGQEQYRNKHDKGYCPVFLFLVGSTPIVWQEDYQYTDTIVGESIFAPNRNIFPVLNKGLSDLLTLVRRGVKTPMGYWSADGKKTIKQDIFQVEKAAVVPFKQGEVFQPLMTQTMPANSQELLGIVAGEIQRGSWPHTAYGDVATRLSGYAINQLNAAMTTVIEPFIATVEHSYLIDALELLKQYANSALPAVKVRGRNSKNQKFGYPQAYEISPKRVKGDWHPEIELAPEFPTDEPMKVELARMLREGNQFGIPLLSDQTIRSEILGRLDPDLDDDIIDREWSDAQLINRMYDAYMQFVMEGNQMKAINTLAALRLAMAQGMPQPSGRAPTGRRMSSQALPPEAMGGTPPGSANANPPPATGEL